MCSLTIKEYNHQWYLKNRDKQLKISKEYGMKHREKYSKRTIEWREKNKVRFLRQHRIHARNYNVKFPEKVLIRRISSLVKIPTKQICEECKLNKAIEKHHMDYRDPFAIIFVCLKCHRKLDKDVGKSVI